MRIIYERQRNECLDGWRNKSLNYFLLFLAPALLGSASKEDTNISKFLKPVATNEFQSSGVVEPISSVSPGGMANRSRTLSGAENASRHVDDKRKSKTPTRLTKLKENSLVTTTSESEELTHENDMERGRRQRSELTQGHLLNVTNTMRNIRSHLDRTNIKLNPDNVPLSKSSEDKDTTATTTKVQISPIIPLDTTLSTARKSTAKRTSTNTTKNRIVDSDDDENDKPQAAPVKAQNLETTKADSSRRDADLVKNKTVQVVIERLDEPYGDNDDDANISNIFPTCSTQKLDRFTDKPTEDKSKPSQQSTPLPTSGSTTTNNRRTIFNLKTNLSDLTEVPSPITTKETKNQTHVSSHTFDHSKRKSSNATATMASLHKILPALDSGENDEVLTGFVDLYDQDLSEVKTTTNNLTSKSAKTKEKTFVSPPPPASVRQEPNQEVAYTTTCAQSGKSSITITKPLAKSTAAPVPETEQPPPKPTMSKHVSRASILSNRDEGNDSQEIASTQNHRFLTRRSNSSRSNLTSTVNSTTGTVQQSSADLFKSNKTRIPESSWKGKSIFPTTTPVVTLKKSLSEAHIDTSEVANKSKKGKNSIRLRSKDLHDELMEISDNESPVKTKSVKPSKKDKKADQTAASKQSTLDFTKKSTAEPKKAQVEEQEAPASQAEKSQLVVSSKASAKSPMQTRNSSRNKSSSSSMSYNKSLERETFRKRAADRKSASTSTRTLDEEQNSHKPTQEPPASDHHYDYVPVDIEPVHEPSLRQSKQKDTTTEKPTKSQKSSKKDKVLKEHDLNKPTTSKEASSKTKESSAKTAKESAKTAAKRKQQNKENTATTAALVVAPPAEVDDTEYVNLGPRRSKRAKIDRYAVPVYEFEPMTDYEGRTIMVKKLTATKPKQVFYDFPKVTKIVQVAADMRRRQPSADKPPRSQQATDRKPRGRKKKDNANRSREVRQEMADQVEAQPANPTQPEPEQVPEPDDQTHNEYDNPPAPVLDNDDHYEPINQPEPEEEEEEEMQRPQAPTQPTPAAENNASLLLNMEPNQVEMNKQNGLINTDEEIIYIETTKPNGEKQKESYNMFCFNKHLESRQYEPIANGVQACALSNIDGLVRIEQLFATKTTKHRHDVTYYVQKGTCLLSVNNLVSMHHQLDIIKIPKSNFFIFSPLQAELSGVFF